MTWPCRFIMKTATEYRVDDPDGELETAEFTTAVQLVSVRDGQAVCEANGRRIFIASESLLPRLRGRECSR
jgi:hypothetical protein